MTLCRKPGDKKRWTDEEVQFLVDTHSTLTVAEQATQLERSYSQVVSKRGILLKRDLLGV